MQNENLTPKQVSELLNVPEATLAVWRSTNRVVLPFFKLGHHVRYRHSDIDRFIEQNLRNADGGGGTSRMTNDDAAQEAQFLSATAKLAATTLPDDSVTAMYALLYEAARRAPDNEDLFIQAAREVFIRTKAK